MNKIIYVLVIFLTLSGCGVTGLTSESMKTDYIMCSKGKAGLIYSIFSGDVEFFKITKKADWDITKHVTEEQLTLMLEKCFKGG